MPLDGEIRTVQCIAHRGFAEVYPENTLAAVRGAGRSGAEAVEVDVRRCGSGELVVCHDATVDRITDRSEAVSELSRDDLAGMDVLGSGEGVPTLEAVLTELPEEVGLNVEVKERGLQSDVRDILDGATGWWLSSFDPAVLAAARRVNDTPDGKTNGTPDGKTDGMTNGKADGTPDRKTNGTPDGKRDGTPDGKMDGTPDGNTDGTPDVPTALLVAPDAKDPIATAVGLDCHALHPHVELCTPEFVAAAQEAGLAVNAWTVRSERTARQVADAGVDGVIADAPAWCPGDS